MIAARAFAKLTLSLRVLGRRADGYHELDALTVSVSEPHDVVTVALGERGVRLELSGPARAGVTTRPDNLAVRAAESMLTRAGAPRSAGVTMTLHKAIPAGAGLGGGSADAAAVLLALDRLLYLALPIDEIAALGAALGSDVPFCVRGGAAHMRGRGERIEATATPVPDLHVLIAVPPFAISTPAVYRAWDDLGGPQSGRGVPAPMGIEALYNDLEPAAERVEPRLVAFREELERAAGAPAVLAGSGSAYAVLYEAADAAKQAHERVVTAAIAPTCVVGVTRSRGVELVERIDRAEPGAEKP